MSGFESVVGGDMTDGVGEIVVDSDPDGRVRVQVRRVDGSVWLNQAQMAGLYGTTAQNITRHVRSIYAEGEQDPGATCKPLLQVQSEGSRQVSRAIKHYNLLGLADQLRKAISSYGGDRGDKPGVPVEVALAVLRERFEVVRDLFHGFDDQGYLSPKATDRLAALADGVNHVCGLESDDSGGDPDKAKERYLEAMRAPDKAAGIALHLEGARHLRDEVGFFQAVQGNIQKYTVSGRGLSDTEVHAAIRQIVSGAVTSEGVIDVFGAAGIGKPDISVLSDESLETVKRSEHKNLLLELLKKLPHDGPKTQSRRNVVVARRFSEMLERTLLRYQNRTLTAAQVILELIEVARQLRDAPERGEALGLTEDELAFYDALADHGGVREVMGDSVRAAIAHDLVEAIRGPVTIDWTQKEAVRADMRRKVKRLLRRYGYPPDKQENAVVVVIEQAERVCRDRVGAACPSNAAPMTRRPGAAPRPLRMERSCASPSGPRPSGGQQRSGLCPPGVSAASRPGAWLAERPLEDPLVACPRQPPDRAAPVGDQLGADPRPERRGVVHDRRAADRG